jgi:hypothetical protein
MTAGTNLSTLMVEWRWMPRPLRPRPRGTAAATSTAAAAAGLAAPSRWSAVCTRVSRAFRRMRRPRNAALSALLSAQVRSFRRRACSARIRAPLAARTARAAARRWSSPRRRIAGRARATAATSAGSAPRRCTQQASLGRASRTRRSFRAVTHPRREAALGRWSAPSWGSAHARVALHSC